MRGYYLNSGYAQTSGCKGGVGYSYSDPFGGEEYELEIGHQCNASSKMIAMCCLHDEFLEILRLDNLRGGALSDMVLQKYHALVKEIDEGVETDKEKIREGDKNEEL